MLRSYKFIETPHKQLHENIIAFFNRIEFESGEYSKDFFNEDFYTKIVSHHKKILETPLKKMYEIIKEWNQEKKSNFCLSIRESNEIQRICNLEITPMKLSDIEKEVASVVDVKKLFSDLYKQVLYGEHCKKHYGDIQEHFKQFKSSGNGIFKCPVCGLLPQNTGSEKKEDYDHLLPYSIYPFSSVNFRNLAPICVDCNSDYKEDKDVLGGKKIFYYYDDTHLGISLKATLEDEHNISFAFSYTTQDNRDDEIESWKDIFNIDVRYRNRAKGKADKWYRHYWQFLENATLSSIELKVRKEIYLTYAKSDPDIESIKLPVIEAMENSVTMSKAYQEAAKHSMLFP